MRVFKGFEELVPIARPVVTTGSFDGVHLGHRIILDRLNQIARKVEGESVLITFHPHPRKVLYPESQGKNLKLISSLEEKISLLRQAGLQNLILVKFTRDFSKVSSEEFIRTYLLGMLRAHTIVVGFNHHFGHNKEGDFSYLSRLGKELGFSSEEIPEQLVQHETVSSTKIRTALQSGDIQKANAYLDHYYLVIGPLQKAGDLLGDSFDLCKVPVMEEEKLLPPAGVYAITVSQGLYALRAMGFVKDCAGEKAVYLHFLEEHPPLLEGMFRLSFHKQMQKGDLLKPDTAEVRLQQLKEETRELIF